MVGLRPTSHPKHACICRPKYPIISCSELLNSRWPPVSASVNGILLRYKSSRWYTVFNEPHLVRSIPLVLRAQQCKFWYNVESIPSWNSEIFFFSCFSTHCQASGHTHGWIRCYSTTISIMLVFGINICRSTSWQTKTKKRRGILRKRFNLNVIEPKPRRWWLWKKAFM